jgi:leucyl aminopeptidase
VQVSNITASILDVACDVLIVNLFEGVTCPGGATGAVDRALGGQISEIIEREGFEGKLGQVMTVRTGGAIPARAVVVAGLGKAEKFDRGAVRKASAAAARRAAEMKASKVATILHGAGIGGMPARQSAQATVEGAIIGTYRFVAYKSEPDGHDIAELVIVDNDASKFADAEAGAARGRIAAEAVNRARDLINSPANEVTPSCLADYARRLASEAGLDVTVLEREDIEKLGMGAFASVAKGSAQPPKFIVLTYTPPAPSDRTCAIVGKGITFDSGGLSLKDGSSMATMKDDMSGAAAVLTAMGAIAEIRPPVKVMAIVAATENMPGGRATRPGDIVRAMNGKTIEVENTDAEGRLTLADAVSYAVREGADEIVDLATLTGACVVALGRGMSGLFCNDPSLESRLLACGKASGDLLWPLPIFDDYFENIKSDVADMKNTGGREGSAIAGALLIREFAEGKPWAHLDIAGPAYIDKDNGLVGKGGAGAGVRLLIEYLCGPA